MMAGESTTRQVRLIEKVIGSVAVAALIAVGASLVSSNVHEHEANIRFEHIEQILASQVVDGSPIVQLIAVNTDKIKYMAEENANRDSQIIERIERYDGRVINMMSLYDQKLDRYLEGLNRLLEILTIHDVNKHYIGPSQQ